MSDNFGGWRFFQLRNGEFHVVPEDDLMQHYLNQECPCIPIMNEEGVWEHTSADGREEFETGIRKPS